MRIQTWRYLEITLRGKNSKTNYIQAYLRSKVTRAAAWSKCKFSCSGFPSILVPQLIAQNHSSIELDAASKGWIGWLFIFIRPKSDHCLASVTPSLTNVVETWLTWSCYVWNCASCCYLFHREVVLVVDDRKNKSHVVDTRTKQKRRWWCNIIWICQSCYMDLLEL